MIFINYRRTDTNAAVDRLYRLLVNEFEDAAVFRDVNNIGIGRYPDALRAALEAATVVLAVVGPEWEDARYVDGPRKGHLRLAFEDDWVRTELSTVLRKGEKEIMTVLYNRNGVPQGAPIGPPDGGWLEGVGLRGFELCQAFNLRDTGDDYDGDVGKIVAALREHLQQEHEDGPQQQLSEIPSEDVGRNHLAELLAAARAAFERDNLDEMRGPLVQISEEYRSRRCRDELSEVSRDLTKVEKRRAHEGETKEFLRWKADTHEKIAETMFEVMRRLENDDLPPSPSSPAETAILKRLDMPIVAAKGVALSIGAFRLHDIDIELMPRKITAILGVNGSGKSSLLRVLAHLWAADSGDLSFVFGDGSKPTNDVLEIRREVSFVEQDPSAWPGMLETTLYAAAENKCETTAERDDAVDNVVQRLGLEALLERTWSGLSCGERMRLELARAMVRRPSVLVLDEPLAWIDPQVRVRFMMDLGLIARSTQHPMTVVLTSHHVEFVERYADQIVCLDEGRVVLAGTTGKLYPADGESVVVFDLAGDSNEVATYDGESSDSYGRNVVLRTTSKITMREALARVKNTSALAGFRRVTQSVLRHFLVDADKGDRGDGEA